MSKLFMKPKFVPPWNTCKDWIEPVPLNRICHPLGFFGCDDRFFPTIKPAIPELHTHEWPFLTMLIKEFPFVKKVYMEP